MNMFFKRFTPDAPPRPGRVIRRFSPAVAVLLSLAVTLVVGGIYFYVSLPALNVHNTGLYVFLIILSAVFMVSMRIFGGGETVGGSNKVTKTLSHLKLQPVPAVIIVLCVAVLLVGNAIGLPLFRANDYAKIITFKEGDFASDINEIDWDKIPLLDGDSANRLANRKLGELSELVSQFTVSDDSAQINYRNTPVRVTYLNYSDMFKWLSNHKEGIPAYIKIDMRTQDVDVVRLDEKMKYSPSEYFGRDLMRHLRFEYPTFMFDNVNFEIDDEGTPYWVASVVKKTIGLFNGTDINGAVLMNALTGECTYYEIGDVPTWVDRVYSADLLVEQYDYSGLYKNGFFNSLFTQSGCTVSTEGYNYVVLEDDVWMYTGVTSVTSDEGNIGFILVNQRTKEAKYYSCAGAKEYSAMDSAQGAVQQYGYEATFPLLLNINGQPTYFMALKDSAGLVKMYALVNVQQYQIVSTGYTLDECRDNYYELLGKNGLLKDDNISDDGSEDNQETPEPLSIEGTLAEIRSANIDGNTVYYLLLDSSDVYFTVSAKDFPDAPLLDVGDKVTVEYYDAEGESIIKAEKMSFEKGTSLE